MTETVQVFLSSSQKKKFEKGETFQLSASQLQSGTGKFHVEIEMTTKNHKELLRNVSKNKGYRFTSAKVVGGSILGNIAKNIGKKIAKKDVGKILDKIGEKTGQKGITNFIKDEAVDGLIDFGADKISGGKMQKGSEEMRQHMARLRSMRKGKGMTDSVVEGEGIFDDIKNGWNRTFNPKLGRKIKKALTSNDAKEVYKGIADFGIGTAAAFTGRPIVGAIAAKLANRGIDGSSTSITNYNVLLSGANLYQQNLNYNVENFIQELRKTNSVNGGMSLGMSSGLINQLEYESGYRFIVSDLSRTVSEASDNVSKSIQVIGTNSGKYAIDIYWFLMFEREVEIDIGTGSLIA